MDYVRHTYWTFPYFALGLLLSQILHFENPNCLEMWNVILLNK